MDTQPSTTPPSKPSATAEETAARLQEVEDVEATPTSDAPAPLPHLGDGFGSGQRHTGKVILSALVWAVLGAALALGIYKFYVEKPAVNSPAQAQDAGSIDTSVKTDAASLISNLKSRVKAKEVETTSENSFTMATTKDGMGAWSVTYAQPKGYEFYTLPETMAGFTVATNDTALAASDVASVRSYLASQGLSAGLVTFDMANKVMSSSEFINEDVRCLVALTEYAYKSGSEQVQVGCADSTSYTKNAEAVSPLYKAYLTAHPEIKVAGLFFARPTIKSSTVNGYQNASLTTGNIFSPYGGSVAHLYKTPDNTWHYFQNSQDELMCSSYNTSDLKNAFAGTGCALENGNESTVKP